MRLRPVATGMSAGGVADVDQPPAEPLGRRSELARSVAAARACRRRCRGRLPAPRRGSGSSSGLRTPPVFATPMTSDRAPRACGFPGREARQAGGDRRLRQREFADAQVPRPVAQAERGLREAGLGDVPEEQQVRLRQLERRTVVAGRAGRALMSRSRAASDDQNATSTPRPKVRGWTGTTPK